MGGDSGYGTRIRVIDLETTGLDPSDAVVEIAAVDVVGEEIIIVGSELVRPPITIPPEASAVHHITNDDVSRCGTIDEYLPLYLDQAGTAGVIALASHNWRFDSQWIGGHIGKRVTICTYRCAMKAWPDAPAYNNQTLRYWLRPKGLNTLIASCSHRALPDAYVTAFILRELLRVASVEQLAAWTSEPILLPKVTFGKHKGRNWSEVPPDYLAWIVDKSDLNEDIKFTANHHRRLRLGLLAAPEVSLASATRLPA
jgi:exodeoxyribonuclease X